jgi:TonB family protein
MKNASLILLATLCTVAALPRCGVCAPSPNRIPDDAAGVERWKSDLHAADHDLRAGKWEEASREAAIVLRSMEDHMRGGEGAGQLLATALLFEAVAEEGLGKSDDALWDWLTARNLYPDAGTVDLGVYGAAGVRLHERIAPELVPTTSDAPPPAATSASPGPTSPWARAHVRGGIHTVTAAGALGELVTKPAKIASPPPEYPKGALHSCQSGVVVIESILDKTGKVSNFHVLQSLSPLLDLAALQAMHQWRFEPARLADKPVAVFYSLTISFKAPGCTPRV